MLNSTTKNQKNFENNEEKSKHNNSEHNKELIDLIMTEACLTNLPAADEKYVRDSLSLQIDRRLGLIILENLNKEGQEEYSKLLEDGPIPDPEKLKTLLNKYFPNYAEKIKAGLDEFLKEAIASFSK